MSASKAAIVAMPVGVRGDAGDVWRAAIGCGGVVGARGWPLAVHVCYESRLLPRRRACDEDKYCRAMQRQNMSLRRARARVAAISLCRIAHASSVLRMCSRTPVCHVAIKRQRLSRLARFLLSADKDAQRMYYKLPIKVLKRRLDASCDQ